MNYKNLNNLLLTKLAYFLNYEEKSITKQQIKQITSLGIDDERAFSLLLENYLDIDDEIIINDYFPQMIKKLDNKEFMNNAYYQNILSTNTKIKNWRLKIDKYDAYEAFVFDDFKYLDNGMVVPQIGFFNTPFYYLAVYENDRLWMSITPNEIMTMKEPIEKAYGKVLTLGLGMGYYAYMTSLKDNVESVTIIEKDENVIELFKKIILPQFDHPKKIRIIHSDAFSFLEQNALNYDFLFADIWHDASDGKELYLKLKPYEEKHPNITFTYWIEKTIKYYL